MNNVTRYEFEVYEGGGEVVVSETGCFVDYDDYLSQLQQTDALQTSLNNIINAFGIKGEGAHSKLVIEYVSGLVAENAALKHGKPTWGEIKRAIDIIHCNPKSSPAVAMEAAYDYLRSARTPATDAAIAEIKAQGVDEFADHMQSEKPFWEPEDWESMDFASEQATQFAANLRAGRNG